MSNTQLETVLKNKQDVFFYNQHIHFINKSNLYFQLLTLYTHMHTQLITAIYQSSTLQTILACSRTKWGVNCHCHHIMEVKCKDFKLPVYFYAIATRTFYCNTHFSEITPTIIIIDSVIIL